MTKEVYQFKIVLANVQPSVWRRIQVPSSFTFWDLHLAIQESMGWLNCHLHDFEITNPKSGDVVRIGIFDEECLDDFDILPGEDHKIAAYFSLENKRAFYAYDFGDDWQHLVTLEKIEPVIPGQSYPVCLAGKNACPPEDCGGVWGYAKFLEKISDPEDEEHESLLEWAGGSFDPEAFDPKAVIFSSKKE